MIGRLYVFEGPDGVGKTELSKRFSAWLTDKGVRCEHLTFPGATEGSLGKHIYDLHHQPERFDVSSFTPTSRQLLHVAAHIDSIESTIQPLLKSGVTIVLDRYWWSTRVYGTLAGVRHKALSAMIDLELSVWGRRRPDALFLIRRKKPLGIETSETWSLLSDGYEKLAAERGRPYPVYAVDNEGTIAETLSILQSLVVSQNSTESSTQSQMQLSFANHSSSSRAPSVFSALPPARPSPIFDTYWRFAAERQAIFFRRLNRAEPPWTTDPILSEYKFTNAYRASDRVSQFLIRRVIYEGDLAPEEVFFRTLLFKLFNKIETWNLLEKTLGVISYREHQFDQIDQLLTATIDSGTAIYSAAYIMPSGSRGAGTTRKHRSHLRLLQTMMEDEVPHRLREAETIRAAFELLKSYPMLGDFLAYQYVTDLNYSTLVNFEETEFVIPGPGARSGIAKCFESRGGLDEMDLIKLVADHQEEEFSRRDLKFQSLWGRPLQLIDCQNLFCEVDKYARVYHPEFVGKTNRTRIKQRFRPKDDTIQYWYPPKWGINDRITASAGGSE